MDSMIREANPDDLKSIYQMIEAYHREYSVRGKQPISFEWQKAASQIYNWLHNENCINYINEHGVIMGEVGQTWFSADKVANVHWCFVWPVYRNGLIARSLIKHFIDEAQKRGALYVMWDDWVGMTDTRMLGKFLGHFGFEIQGNVHRLTVGVNHAAIHGVSAAYFVDSGAPVGESARGQ
jgi:N-acetylglutamate synthase-like GNAT family acetyltransferase